METTQPIITELRKLETALRSNPKTRNVGLVICAAANQLEKYETLRDHVRDIRDTLRDGSDRMDVKTAVAKINGIHI